ncbi:very short patch repair endonuclease [Hymenobacter sp. ASUV-10]|uniref:Very short patch repair endonuclease n=1 Tax=Hymenobacter aranciens TaxID=3063996 RepID=A0ABT9B7Q5_9BACT|nr:very short patch repair endonuclease [Hymenobacter sp. ASUV-10]MDO7874305.1 very short patch repair endonuclease [Hymenobacter sp. ASUV-10]
MATTQDAAHRNKMMRAVKSKNSKIETALAKALWSKGYRYRKNYTGIIGKPDIVFTRLRLAIFIDSEFWHGKNWETEKAKIKNDLSFWQRKIETNVARDVRVNAELATAGWHVLRFWGNDVKKRLDECVETIETTIKQLTQQVG